MKVRAPERSGKVAPLRRRSNGSFAPEIRWLLYAGNPVAPLRRQSGGAFTPTTKWILYAENSHTIEVAVESNSSWTLQGERTSIPAYVVVVTIERTGMHFVVGVKAPP